jgi:adenosine deaminase
MASPYILLHDHLDGGLRPSTLIELADEVGYRSLPETDPEALADRLDQSRAGSLERYLQAFDHTVAVMATPGALRRVAYESITDLATDGVVHAEIRFAPSLTAVHGLGIEETLEAVCDGLRSAATEHQITWGFIVDALRHLTDSEEVVERSLSVGDPGIVGFDLAGPEAGFPPRLHEAAIRRAVDGGLRLTIHAGEAAGADGPAYMAEAVDLGAERLGHGVEIIRDCVVEGDEIVEMGPVASMIRDRGVVLEVCPTSNAATGNIPLQRHPLPLLYRAGFAVTINTDNRLMSRTSMSHEAEVVRTVLGMDEEALEAMTTTARGAAFVNM